MKNILMKPVFMLLAVAGLSTSCTDMLMVESETTVTSDYLFTTSDGLARAAAALYVLDKEIILDNVANSPIWLFDALTDISMSRGGDGYHYAHLESSVTSDYGAFSSFWNTMYAVIGKSNEVIAAAEAMGLDEDETTLNSWAEAKTFRAKCYFDLYKRFERILLNTEPTTVDNLTLDYTPATKDAVFAQINQDLQDVIDCDGLGWEPANGQSGRLTMAVVKHIKADVAMWEQDWDEAIELCESIFERSEFGMMDSAIECFQGADLNCKENLYVMQFSSNVGGYVSLSSGAAVGHRLAIIVNPIVGRTEPYYNSDDDWLLENGGYSWARMFPNTYLFGLYDQATDERYTDFYRHKYYLSDSYSNSSYPDYAPGQEIVSPGMVSATDFAKTIHPMNLKYYDIWTNADEPTRSSSFKDVPIYRLAQTYIMAAEAYYRKGNNSKAVECYNMTWERANPGRPFTGTLSLQDIIDEHARELNFEGVRWCFLKRLGILESQVKLYGGESMEEEPRLASDFCGERTAFSYQHWYWPIPLTQIELMGTDNFPQNPGW